MNIEHFIKDVTDDTSDLGEQLVNIDVDNVNREGKWDAHKIVDNLAKCY